MKIRKKLILAVSAMLLGAVGSGFALDLSQYQGYLSGNRRKAAVQEQKQSNVLPEVPSNNYRSQNEDAYYVTSEQNQFIPLGNNQPQKDGERFLIPPDTRVPKELKPLLVEQRTPRQGLALNGGTGDTETIYTIESDSFTLPKPKRTGFIFMGWTGDNGDTPQKAVTIPQGSTGNRSYTANWVEGYVEINESYIHPSDANYCYFFQVLV